MTEPTEYPIPLPVTDKMADRMRAAGWRPVTYGETWRRGFRVTKVVDGDTIEADVDLGYHIHEIDVSYRVARINAPEKRGPTKAAGLVAKAFTEDWLTVHAQHGGLFATSTKTDDWRRWLAEITCADGHNLSDDMLAAGQAVVYK